MITTGRDSGEAEWINKPSELSGPPGPDLKVVARIGFGAI